MKESLGAAQPLDCATATEELDRTAAEETSAVDREGEALLDDAAAAPEDEPMTFEEQVAQLREMTQSSPRFRELEYRVLGLCMEQRMLSELEELIGKMPEFKTCGQNQYRIIVYLEEAGGLERLEIDEAGNTVTPEMIVGLTEDEIDDLVCDYAFLTTEAGRAVYEEMKPEKRIDDLLKIIPARASTYREVLEFCKQPRAFKEIDALLSGRDVLKSGSLNPMTNIPLQPSVFVDNLERSGGIVWDGAWKLTEGGRRFLEALNSVAS